MSETKKMVTTQGVEIPGTDSNKARVVRRIKAGTRVVAPTTLIEMFPKAFRSPTKDEGKLDFKDLTEGTSSRSTRTAPSKRATKKTDPKTEGPGSEGSAGSDDGSGDSSDDVL